MWAHCLFHSLRCKLIPRGTRQGFWDPALGSLACSLNTWASGGLPTPAVVHSTFSSTFPIWSHSCFPQFGTTIFTRCPMCPGDIALVFFPHFFTYLPLCLLAASFPPTDGDGTMPLRQDSRGELTSSLCLSHFLLFPYYTNTAFDFGLFCVHGHTGRILFGIPAETGEFDTFSENLCTIGWKNTFPFWNFISLKFAVPSFAPAFSK